MCMINFLLIYESQFSCVLHLHEDPFLITRTIRKARSKSIHTRAHVSTQMSLMLAFESSDGQHDTIVLGCTPGLATFGKFGLRKLLCHCTGAASGQSAR